MTRYFHLGQVKVQVSCLADHPKYSANSTLCDYKQSVLGGVEHQLANFYSTTGVCSNGVDHQKNTRSLSGQGKGIPAGKCLDNAHALKDEVGICYAQHILVAQRHRLHVCECGGMPFRMDDCDWVPLPRLVNHTS